VAFNFVAKVSEVYKQLANTTYNGFPVMNSKGQPIGIIERDTLVVVLGKHCWYRNAKKDIEK
jgi:hypothetical protein